ncbi:MAG TPA: hypothetical protein VMG08_15640 [Allosphingosinicella sp.]|nr:hypothetical protein [Allosphingosinicella sp.]
MGVASRTGHKRGIFAGLTALAVAMPGAAPAQLFLVQPNFPSAPIEGSDPLVGLPLPGATPAEYRAHLLWNLRSGLNVAALQCQFSPFLRTVSNYNALLAHHNRELAAAYTTLEGYFRRRAGRTGPRQFDLYSTQTYNGFSALNAQLGFCQTASRIGKEALSTPKGQFGQLAANRMRELRSSLIVASDGYSFTRAQVRLTPIALSRRDCSSLPRRERRECEQER